MKFRGCSQYCPRQPTFRFVTWSSGPGAVHTAHTRLACRAAASATHASLQWCAPMASAHSGHTSTTFARSCQQIAEPPLTNRRHKIDRGGRLKLGTKHGATARMHMLDATVVAHTAHARVRIRRKPIYALIITICLRMYICICVKLII